MEERAFPNPFPDYEAAAAVPAEEPPCARPALTPEELGLPFHSDGKVSRRPDPGGAGRGAPAVVASTRRALAARTSPSRAARCAGVAAGVPPRGLGDAGGRGVREARLDWGRWGPATRLLCLARSCGPSREAVDLWTVSPSPPGGRPLALVPLKQCGPGLRGRFLQICLLLRARPQSCKSSPLTACWYFSRWCCRLLVLSSSLSPGSPALGIYDEGTPTPQHCSYVVVRL